MPKIAYSLPEVADDADKGAAAIKLLARQGRHHGQARTRSPRGQYYGTVFNKDRAKRRPHVQRLGPGLAQRLHGHPAAVHPERWLRPLATSNDKAYNAKVAAAKAETDRTKQSQLWQALEQGGHARTCG